MKRNAMSSLIEWKDNNKRMPLIIKGARQVGKTWLMKEFGKQHFSKTAYINFDKNPRMQSLFSGDFSLDRILRGLSIESGTTIVPDSTLIILDEIQEVPAALQSLKYFSEDEEHNYYIIAAGSLLGVALHQGTSFPVGKVDSLNLYPLSFTEFLDAIGETSLLELLSSCDYPMITTFKDRYIDALKMYFYIGGMPASVNAYISTKDFKEVRNAQKRLLNDYEQDFSKHAPTDIVPRLRMVWDGIPSQLAKENKKFVYGVLREGARAKDFELAIQWLIDCGLCYKINRVKKGGYPLKPYIDMTAFKLFLHDVGLLAAMADIDEHTLLYGNDIFTEFKGSLTEQYICQQLISELGIKPYYWSAEKSSGEIDFIIQYTNNILPIEVKANENLNAKSLKTFVASNNLAYGIRTSMSDYREQERLINIPLYAISQITKVIDNLI